MSHNQINRADSDAAKKSPNYRPGNSPTADEADCCQPTKPQQAPSSAAENHDAANQKCTVNEPQTASKDEHEKATG